MIAQYLSHTEIDLYRWDALVSTSPQGSIFMQTWYIQAMLGEWSGIVINDKNGDLQAVMALHPKKKFGFTYSLQPILAKYWGICFAQNTFPNHYEEYSWKKKVLEAIIAAIPQKLAKFHHNFHPAFDYSLPFYWKNYTLITKFTYILPLKNDLNVEHNFSKSVLKKINKARKSEITIKAETGLELLFSLLIQNEEAQKTIVPKTYFPAYERIVKSCKERNQCFMLSAFSDKDEGIASGIFLQDANSTYFLSGIVSPLYRQSAAMPLLVTAAIKQAAENTQQFDFMGSTIESIESFFRSFGPKPVAYMGIEKNALPFI